MVKRFNAMEFRLGELFCGPGGLAFGALQAKIENPEYRIIHQWANDYDRSTCDTYIRNICPNNPDSVICEDVHFLDINSLGSIDALAFGFPCNDFSVVGEIAKNGENVFTPIDFPSGINSIIRNQPSPPLPCHPPPTVCALNII